MSGAVVEIDPVAVEGNARAIVELCAGHGIDVMGVTKAVWGHPGVAAAMVRGGVTSIGDSRLENVARLRASGIDVPIALLRAPAPAQADEVVSAVDVALHIERVTLERVGAAARAAGRVHDVILMVDLGDRREGVVPEELPGLARAAAAVPGLRLVGVGTNLTCLAGLAPTAENMAALVSLTEQVEDAIERPLTWISGGNSSALELVAAGAMPARVNQLRIGEAILLGCETLHRRPWPGTVQDAVVVRAAVVEVKDKPDAPEGPRGDRAFTRAPDVAGAGGRRALVALGRADVDVEGLTPVAAGHRIVGASSDYIVVDVTDAADAVAVGDELSFSPDYGALVTAAGSRSVSTRLVARPRADGQP